MGPDNPLGSNCCDIPVLRSPTRCCCPWPAQRDGRPEKGKRGKLTASFLRCHFLEPFPRFSDLYVSVCSCPYFSLLPCCPLWVCSAACSESSTATSLQEAGLGPGLWRNADGVWTERLYLQEARRYPRCGGFGGYHLRCQHFSSPAPGHVWAMGGLAPPADIGIGMWRAQLIASGDESSQSGDWQANGQPICLPALHPSCKASLSPQLGLCPLPTPIWASSGRGMLLSWLSSTLCATIISWTLSLL